jgi:hypothetical protein
MLTNPDDIHKRTMNQEVIDRDKELIRNTFIRKANKLTQHDCSFVMPRHGFSPKLVYKYTYEFAKECNKEGKTHGYHVAYDYDTEKTTVTLFRHPTKWEEIGMMIFCMMITLFVLSAVRP